MGQSFYVLIFMLLFSLLIVVAEVADFCFVLVFDLGAFYLFIIFVRAFYVFRFAFFFVCWVILCLKRFFLAVT
jgi:hypothetical protein